MSIQDQLGQLRRQVKEDGLRVVVNTKEVEPGSIFVALPPAVACGESGAVGGEQYIEEAVSKGALYIVVEPLQLSVEKEISLQAQGVQVVRVPSTRKALGYLAQVMHNTHLACPKLIGITGTNGKTTESYLLEHLFVHAGYSVGVIGTVAYKWPNNYIDAPLTTPSCLALHEMLGKMHKAGVEYVFMEVSSHALDQERVAGLEFTGALLTNVTQDHLDYHKSMNHYFAAKKKLFVSKEQGGVPYYIKARCVNTDDPFGYELARQIPEVLAFGLQHRPELANRQLIGRIESMQPHGMKLAMKFEGQQWELESPLVGDFNAMNLLGAQAMGLALGFSVEQLQGLSTFSGVAGRLERVVTPSGINAFVDYAHTPDALEKVLTSLRAAGFKRIITVFGCGGDRDKTKRPLMGKAAAEYSDVVVVTSDNPRTENPAAIINDILPGIGKHPHVVVEENRRTALEKAVALVEKDDALLVAGKGHETYQIVGTTKFPFSDHAILQELLS